MYTKNDIIITDAQNMAPPFQINAILNFNYTNLNQLIGETLKLIMAERVGFEPTVPLTVHMLSKPKTFRNI